MATICTQAPATHPHTLRVASVCIFFIALGFLLCVSATLGFATPLGHDSSLTGQDVKNPHLNEVYVRRGSAVRTRTVVGPRGGVYHGRTAVGGRAVVRPGYHGGGTRWVRPGHYWWPAGGAIAAGAAIGVVTAATAAAWAGAPPAPGYCWYYTDPSRRQGFWDVCQ